MTHLSIWHLSNMLMLAFNQYIVIKKDNESINFVIEVANFVLFQIAADNNCNKVVRYGHKKTNCKILWRPEIDSFSSDYPLHRNSWRSNWGAPLPRTAAWYSSYVSAVHRGFICHLEKIKSWIYLVRSTKQKLCAHIQMHKSFYL